MIRRLYLGSVTVGRAILQINSFQTSSSNQMNLPAGRKRKGWRAAIFNDWIIPMEAFVWVITITFPCQILDHHHMMMECLPSRITKSMCRCASTLLRPGPCPGFAGIGAKHFYDHWNLEEHAYHLVQPICRVLGPLMLTLIKSV